MPHLPQAHRSETECLVRPDTLFWYVAPVLQVSCQFPKKPRLDIDTAGVSSVHEYAQFKYVKNALHLRFLIGNIVREVRLYLMAAVV